jgi:hypothetical protein
MAEYNDIFRPETLAKLNAKSAESARILLGNRDLMRVMMSSQSLLGKIIRAEAPYKSRLENLAVSMITEMYPTISQENINVDARIVSMSDVGDSLDEATPNEKRRRVINAITQGASVKSLEELFRIFKGHIDEINPALYDQYNTIMGEVFGIYDNDDAISMMLAAVASGDKMAGGSSKIVISEALGIRARAICFPMLVHELIKGYYAILGQKGLKGDRETKQTTIRKVDLLKNEPSDIRYGKFIYSAINNIFLAFADTDDKRVQSFFFQDIYDLGDDEFFPFIENAINEELTPQQIDWVQTTIESIISDLGADDFDATGVSESTKLTDIVKSIIQEESTQYRFEGLLQTDTIKRPQKDILSDIRALTGVTIVSTKDYDLSGESTAFSNPNYYSILKIKVDPHPFMSGGGFKDETLQTLLSDIRKIDGVKNFKLTQSVEKAIV